MKIGDIVNINATNEIVGVGVLAGVSSDQPLCKFWMVLLLRRNTEFLKNRPEKVLNLIETILTPSTVELTSEEQLVVNCVFGKT